MVPSSIIYLPMLILQAETRAVILYVSIFASLVILGYIWYLLFHSNRKEIQIQVPIYPFFQSVGGTAEEKINGTLQSDKLTRPINKTSLELGFNEFIDRSMYSYPDPPSKFLSDINSSKITFSPFQFYQFNLWHQFSNRTRSWIWDMKYSDHILVNHPTQKWQIVENHPQSAYTDLDQLTEIIEREGFKYSINPAPKINELSTVKEIIQQSTTIEKKFKDENNQQRNKVCTADISKINVQTSTIFWGSSVDMKAKIGDDTEIELQLHESKVSKVLNQNEMEGLLDKTTIVCQECKKITKPAKYFRNLDYCQACGKVLCDSCGHTEVKLAALKTHWCSECWSQIKMDKKEKNKNKEAIRKLKKSFKEWQIC
ncbi:MAG: B-box zinc finger protein [Promethearchaeota archaeon]